VINSVYTGMQGDANVREAVRKTSRSGVKVAGAGSPGAETRCRGVVDPFVFELYRRTFLSIVFLSFPTQSDQNRPSRTRLFESNFLQSNNSLILADVKGNRCNGSTLSCIAFTQISFF
jgi:hypothetical protein